MVFTDADLEAVTEVKQQRPEVEKALVGTDLMTQKDWAVMDMDPLCDLRYGTIQLELIPFPE